MSSIGLTATDASQDRRRAWLVVLLLVVTTFAVYWQVRDHEFLNYDDNIYVSENEHVQAGLTGDTVVWAFARPRIGHWHPLTWLSYMVDVELFGVNPRALHTTNLILHAANTVLLFFVLKRMTGALWRSAFVAALFALHPLHVEPVAWISSRKDVLSGVFLMLTLLAYVRYVERPGILRYLLLALSFAMGLMSKPMLVTLPFVLLLLDYWPLGRMAGEPKTSDGGAGVYWRLFREKLPLFAMAAMSCVMAYYAGKTEGVLPTTEIYPMRVRIPNAVVSYVKYIGKMLWPRHLAVHYPLPRDPLPVWEAAAALLVLVCVSVLVFRLRRRSPYLGVGWAWYVGTLVPVIGIVQVGGHALADRYTYVPLVGLFIMLAWGVPDLVSRWRHRRVGLAVSALASIAALTVCTWNQLGYWRNSVTLCAHAVRVTTNNFKMHYNLGLALLARGSIEGAARHFAEAVLISPDYADARSGLGAALLDLNKTDEAAEQFSEVLRLDPDSLDGHYNLGNALLKQGRFEEAIVHYREAIRINPDYADAHYNLGIALVEQGQLEEAVVRFSEVIRIAPENVRAYDKLGTVLKQQGKLEDAIKRFSEALRIKPDDAHARGNLGSALLDQGKIDEAIDHLSKALVIQPDYVKARTNLGIALAGKGRIDEAIAHLSRALAVDPDNADAHYNMGVAMVMRGNNEGAATHFSEVLRIKPEDVDARFNLGAVLMAAGRLAEAAREFEEVLRLKPDHGNAREYLNRIRQSAQKSQEGG